MNPLWVLLGLCGLALPVLAVWAWDRKDRFLALSLGVWLAGVALVFSTDYLFQNVLQPHQRSRIEVLLGLKEDPSGVGYNVLQSKIAIGSGGLFGKGPADSSGKASCRARRPPSALCRSRPRTSSSAP